VSAGLASALYVEFDWRNVTNTIESWRGTMISVTCPNCSHGFEAPTDTVGKEAKCSLCGHSFVLQAASPLLPQEEPELVLYPVTEPIPIRWNPIKIGAWILLGFLVLGGLVAIAPQIDAFARWAVYPNQKEDEDRYKRMGDRIERNRQRRGLDN
jgi:hypothetical protein